jgi:hypothetical protein
MSSVLEFFDRFPTRAVANDSLNSVLAEPDAPALTVLLLWGRDCPNCDVAKRAILADPARLSWPDVRWLHCNVYDEPDMATRFSLHGVPVFVVFRGVQSLGRMTGWPGMENFICAIERQRALAGCEAPAVP